MTSIVDTLQAIVRHELRNLRIADLGLVEAVYPHRDESDQDHYGCDVRLKNSGLLLKRVPVATGHIGTAAIPNIGDLVLLTYDHGDVNQPIIIGRLYNDQDRPPGNDSDEVIFRLPLAAADEKSVTAAIRNHPSQSPPRELVIAMAPKIVLRITDGTVRATAGKTELKLDQPDGGGGTVTIVAGGTTMTLDQDGDLTIEAAGSMRLKASGDLSLEGANVSIKGQMKTSIEAGSQASLKGNAGATLDGGLSATVQGANLSLKGLTTFSP